MARSSSPEIEERLTSPSFRVDPHPTYHMMRHHAPVYWSEHRGHWLVTSFDAIDRILGDPATFSSMGFERRRIGALAPGVAAHARVVGDHFDTLQLVSSDPPDHTRLRRAFGSKFLPREVAPLEPTIRAAAERTLDSVQSDALDIVSDYAEPLPVEVVSEIIGVPPEARDRIPVVTMDQREFFGAAELDVDHARRFSATIGEWHDLLSVWMDDRRAAPRDDVLTRAADMVDEGRVSHGEAVATLLHLVIAGNGTTTALIGSAIYHLLRHEGQARRLADDPEAVPNAIEEVLRFETPLPSDRRIATRTVTVDGQTIEEGDLVMSILAAGNRDPAHFPDPDTFDTTRSFEGAHHVAFGRGIHLCLGAPVARLEAAVAIRVFFERFGVPRLVEGFEPDWHAITTHRGLKTLPLERGAG